MGTSQTAQSYVFARVDREVFRWLFHEGAAFDKDVSEYAAGILTAAFNDRPRRPNTDNGTTTNERTLSKTRKRKL